MRDTTDSVDDRTLHDLRMTARMTEPGHDLRMMARMTEPGHDLKKTARMTEPGHGQSRHNKIIKALRISLLSGLRSFQKEGGFLLSRIALQYHRRKWA